MGENAEAPELPQAVVPDAPRPPVADLLRPAEGADSLLSLSRSSPLPDNESFCSVRRLSKDAGGLATLLSSRGNREFAPGDAREEFGNGYDSLVSRRRLPGRADVGEESPNAPGLFTDCEIEGLRWDPASLGVVSLFVNVGGFIGELTEPLKSYFLSALSLVRHLYSVTHILLVFRHLL